VDSDVQSRVNRDFEGKMWNHPRSKRFTEA
jgi:hypothetical protein